MVGQLILTTLTKLQQDTARARGETFLSKLKLQFQRSATENALISSQLNSPELLKLTGLPARLVVALYEHSSVEQHFRGTGGQTYPGESPDEFTVCVFYTTCYAEIVSHISYQQHSVLLIGPLFSAQICMQWSRKSPPLTMWTS